MAKRRVPEKRTKRRSSVVGGPVDAEIRRAAERAGIRPGVAAALDKAREGSHPKEFLASLELIEGMELALGEIEKAIVSTTDVLASGMVDSPDPELVRALMSMGSARQAARDALERVDQGLLAEGGAS
jgi:hypothetical protein